MEVTGTLVEIFPTQEITTTFKKREFVLRTSEETPYPQDVLFQVTQDKCGYLDKYVPGDRLDVNYNLKGKKSTNGKYFNTIEAWRFEKSGS